MADAFRDKVGQILEEAREVPPERREEFLDERCEEGAVRAEVASLLAVHEEAAGLFDELAETAASALGELEETEPNREATDPLGIEGRRVGRYVVEEHLGSGGMGIVYRARDRRLDRPVALKFLPPRLAAHPEAEERFVREAKTAASLGHSHIATIHEIGRADEGTAERLRYIAMAYYEGDSLKEKIERDGALPVGDALKYAEQIAGALAQAHEAGVVHRDVKPANVMITEDGEAKLLDFGLAQAAAGTGLTETGRRLGTAAYMSPEQARGDDVGPRTDLWALGALLYEMVTGERPFQGERQAAILHAVLHGEPTPLAERRPELPAVLGRVVRRCLEKDPADRYDSAAALREDLGALRAGEKPAPRGTSPFDTTGQKRGPRRWELGGRSALLFVLAGASVLVLSLLGGWWYFGGGTDAGQQAGPKVSSLDSNRVVVFPFEVRGDEEIEYLGESMVELVGRSMGGAGSLQAVDPKAVLAQVRGTSGRGPSPDSARRISARLGAGRFVLGSVLKLGEELRLSATWYSADGRTLGSDEVTGENEGDIQQMVDQLARSAIADLTEEGGKRRRRLAAQTTASAEALKAYLEGQAAFRTLNYQEAARAFSNAVTVDSTFALAHYRLALALGWTGQEFQRAHDHIQRAVALSGSLPRRDRRLIRAYAAYNAGKAERAERLYRSLAQRHPNDVEVHLMLGEVLFHFNPSRGRPVDEADRHFRRALQVDSTFRIAFPHRIHIALAERDTSRLDSLTQGTEKIRYQVLRAYVRSDGAEPELRDQLRKDPLATWITAYSLGAAGKPQAVREILGPLTTPQESDEMQVSALFLQADALAAEGKLEAARQKIGETAPLDSAVYWMGRSHLAGLPFVPGGKEAAQERQAVRRGLATWSAETVPERLLPLYVTLPRELYPAARLYQLGLLRAVSGDHGGALQVARQLESMSMSSLAGSASHDFAQSIRAEIQRRRGDAEGALAHLRRRENRAGPIVILLDPMSGARERFLRAELLAGQGRLEESLRWYRTLTGIARGELPYLAPAHLGRAEVLEKLGRPKEAIRSYERFLDLWKNADPALQPTVEKARRQLAAVRGDTTAASSLGTRSH